MLEKLQSTISYRNILSSLKLTDLYWPAVQPIDIVDIVIVAFLLYQVVVWIKETRAWSLFKGLIVVMVFSLIAVTFKLNTILWILKNAINVGIIAVIVVFQPELRKALEQLGRGRFIAQFLVSEQLTEQKCSTKTFEEILIALDGMSATKTGALILIEQQVPLGDHERTGIPIDSIVSSQLILNIFEHNTPLHDGAVIIKNNRIVAATCFLPLTETKMSMDLGTRHRAAVGASEVSDAFVLVVSEETGSISVAQGGKLYRHLTTDQIRSMFFANDRPVEKKRFRLLKGTKKSG